MILELFFYIAIKISLEKNVFIYFIDIDKEKLRMKKQLKFNMG